MDERPPRQLGGAVATLEGEGFEVRRAFPTPHVQAVDPFLLLDHVGPRDLAPGEAKGAPDHPHRGFETVTYVLEGEAEHKDSVGSRARLAPGDVQWMTAGAGVVHSEMPSEEIRRHGGRLHFLQLWVNLPASDKMVPPRYQDVPAAQITRLEPAAGATVRLVAGEAFGATGPVQTHSPFQYVHVTLEPGAGLRVPIPGGHEAFAYVMTGDLLVGSARLDAPGGTLIRFAPAEEEEPAPSEAVFATSDGDEADLIVVSGRPLREPVARYGPFVMNTREEIIQAVEDYQTGKMGRITV